MKKTRFLKYLIACFSIAMLLICGIACRATKGEKEQLASRVEITFYLTDNLYGSEWGTGAIIRHTGTEPRMYLYQYRGQYGVPVYVKQSDEITDFAGKPLGEEFYKMKQDSNPVYVSESTTLIFDYEIYGYNKEGELYHAYSIRIEWEIIIDYIDVPPTHEHTWEESYRVDPTCDAQGYIVSVCSCGLEEMDYISATGHDWGAWTSDGDGVYHSRVCKTDSNHVQRQRCGGGQATCLKRAVCLDCGEEFGLYGNHKYDQYHVCIYCGDGEVSLGVKFYLSDDKTYYIAEAREFSKADQEYLGAKIETVLIPAQYNGKPVKEIAEEGFLYNETIKTLIIFDGVEKIGRKAFNGCTNLEEISLPNSLNNVGFGAFDDTAYAKNEENWTDSVLYVGNWLVAVKNSQTGVCSVKDGTVGIASGVFVKSNFFEINFPDSVQYLDATVNNFTDRLTKISLGAGIPAFNSTMFHFGTNSYKVEIAISEDNPYIKVQDNFILSKDGKTLFWHFGAVSELSIPDGVEKIEAYALAYRGDIQKVHIPDSVVEICEAAFYDCYDLKEITIPDNVQILGKHAFGACGTLESLSIGAGLQEIGENALQVKSEKLTTITLSEENTILLVDDGALYTADGKTLLLYPSNDSRTSFTLREGTEILASEAFYKADNLKEIVFSNSLITIKSKAIQSCYMLRDVVIPDSVQTIEKNAFYNCMGLISVKLGNGLQTIDRNAFYYAYRLVYVYNTSSLKLNDFNVNYTDAAYVTVPVYNDLSGVKLSTDENGFTTYADGDEVILIDYMGEETDIVIPDGVTRIGRRAFHNYTTPVLLLSVTLPDTVKVIEEYAFYGQRKLKQVSCGTGLKEIHEQAFAECSKLENFTLNSVLERIGYDAFGYTPYDPSYDSDSTIDGGYLGNYFLRPAYSAKSFIIHEGTIVLADASICVVEGYGYEYDWVVIPTSVISIGEKDDYYYSPPKAIYYMGTQAQWSNVKNIEVVSSSTMYYYSQTYAENGWRYVNGVPTTWLEDGTQYEEISKVVLMTSDGESGKVIVTGGQEIQLVAKIYPDFYQSITDVTYKVLEDESSVRDGKLIGILDESTGVLKITYDRFRAYNQIKIVAIADGVESNVLTFEMETVPVTSLQFVPNVTYVYARPGETLRLHANVNQDATDMGVSYTLDEAGQKYATLTANAGTATLVIADEIPDFAEHINLIARAEGGITAEQTIIIMQVDFYLLLNGELEDVYLYADESMVLTAEDGDGNAISLANVSLTIYDESWNETDDLTVGANGGIIFKEGFSVEKTAKYVFEAQYGENFSYIFLEVMIRPSDVFVGVAHPKVKAGAYIDLNIIADPFPYIEQKEVYIAWYNYGLVEVVDRDTIYVLPTAQIGDSVIIYIEWKNAYGTTSLMRYYTITVQSE